MAGLGFWFEFGSTYSYLSAVRIGDAAVEAGLRVRWEPFLLGPIFARQGWEDSPFNIYPAKGRYMWRDMERQCERLGVPYARPSRFPRSGVLASRVACLAGATDEPWLPEFVRAVFRANFAEDREIGEAREIRSVLDALGLPGARLIETAQAPDDRRRLRDRTERGSGSSGLRASWSTASSSGGTTGWRRRWRGLPGGGSGARPGNEAWHWGSASGVGRSSHGQVMRLQASAPRWGAIRGGGIEDAVAPRASFGPRTRFDGRASISLFRGRRRRGSAVTGASP